MGAGPTPVIVPLFRLVVGRMWYSRESHQTLMAAGHARCYDCAKRKRSPTCSPDCKEVIRTSSLVFVILNSIDLNDDDWCASRSFLYRRGLRSYRVAKLISARDESQSLDIVALEEAYDMLEEERSELTLSLRDFDLGSTFQTAVEVLVVNTSEIEEAEDTILGEIATETRRLEELELQVGRRHRLIAMADVLGLDSDNQVAYGMA